MADLTSDLRNLATMADGLVTEGSPSPKGSSHIVKDLLWERDLLTLMDIVKRNGGKNQSSASEIVLGMSPRASIGVQSEVPTPSSFVEAMGGLCFEIRDLAQQQKLCFGGEVASSPAVVHSQEYMLRAEYTLPSITFEDAAPERKASIHVKFEIPYFVVSGIQTKRFVRIFWTQICLPTGVCNPHMGQHYLQIYGIPSTINTNIVPYGQMGHPLSGNHGYPTIQGYVTPGRHVLQYGGPLVNGVTTDTITITQAQCLAGVFSQDKSIYEAVENEFITIYVRKIPVETAKNLLHFAIDSNIGDLAALEFIVGALVSKGDITTSTYGGAAFPSEKTAQDCSSSDISSLKINTGSGKTEKTKVKIKMVIELLEGIHFVSSVEAISLGAQADTWRQLHESFSSTSLYQGLDESIMPDGFLSNLKGIVLDMAKSCTFPLPLLAVAFQHLIAGSSHGHGNDGDDTFIKAWEKVYGVNITNAVNMYLLSLLKFVLTKRHSAGGLLFLCS
ncbi:unnamed protein product [Camellia sinensis]